MTAPVDLLALARGLLARTDAITAGLWPRAAALLARQSLEAAVDAFWKAKGVPLEVCAMRPQLVCLATYLRDRDLAGRVHHAWSSLSQACHHHAYELPPTVGELQGWLDTVQRFLEIG